MPNTKQSNTASVELVSVFFMKAFCRPNLSSNQIMMISDIFDFLYHTYLNETTRKRIVKLLLSNESGKPNDDALREFAMHLPVERQTSYLQAFVKRQPPKKRKLKTLS